MDPQVIPRNRSNLTGNGLRMNYQYGKYIREKYPFVTSLPSERIASECSSENRNFMSQQAFFLGLFDYGFDQREIDQATFPNPLWEDFDIKVKFKTPLN